MTLFYMLIASTVDLYGIDTYIRFKLPYRSPIHSTHLTIFIFDEINEKMKFNQFTEVEIIEYNTNIIPTQYRAR